MQGDEKDEGVVQPSWLAEVAQGLDARTRAALVASEPEAGLASLPDEALSLMSAAVRDLQDDAVPRRGGVAPVLGAGVVAEFRKLARAAKDATEAPPEGSHIDAKR